MSKETAFDNYADFFKECGDNYLHPKMYGENLFPIRVEELYQHFKARMMEEIAVESPDLRTMGRLIDASGDETTLAERAK